MHPMRAYSGSKDNAAILSSMNNFSILMYRPASRRNIRQVQKIVIHHATSSVGLASLKGSTGGGSEYSPMLEERERSHAQLNLAGDLFAVMCGGFSSLR